MDFTTLGMFIIDDIYPPPSAEDQSPRLGIPGGAGTYCAVGARILSPRPSSQRVGWIVDCGVDFPEELRETIAAWHTGVLMRSREGPTTKGWNGYSANERRDFKYLTPKIRIAEDDLTPALLSSKSFHMVCAPSRAIDLVTRITARRQHVQPDLPRPIFIYEPNPDHAVPEALDDTLETIKHVDVMSPNHSELAHLFGRLDEVYKDGFQLSVVEECAERLMEHASKCGRKLCVIVRAGSDGCYLAANEPETIRAWFPPFHQTQEKVVDPTGGGNGFLGGFGVGLVRTGDIRQAVAWGTVAASFCIEQIGIPSCAQQHDAAEVWNGEDPQERLEQWKQRVTLGP